MRTFVPFILSFIPNYAPYVEQGFNPLQNIPNPYWFVAGVDVVDTYLNTTHLHGKRSDGIH
ncbi:hypothetical protein [Vibrio apostichopi]|uniref:hypothetical protein n=1 Tax=Vibrio apostichopi TaxID=3035453 RepID=UPI00257414B3|nr:hypothetical protein [Vibrio sp. FE10]